MRIGISTTPCGRLANGAAACATAVAAEQVGYSSLWVPEPGTSDPATALDPLAVLVAAAGATRTLRLGTTAVPRPPVAPLARALRTVDELSDARVTVALAGDAAEEALDALDAAGRTTARRPTVLVAGAGPAAIDLAARRGDGWSAAGIPADALAVEWARVRTLAERYGRDPATLRLVVQATVALTDAPMGGRRRTYEGDLAQVVADIQAAERAGADEVVLALPGDPCLDEALDRFARIVEALLAAGPAETGAGWASSSRACGHSAAPR